MTKKHLLIAGHGYSDPGAHGNGENERDFIRREVIKRVAKYINATKGHKAEMYNLDWNMFADTAAGQRQNKSYGMYKYNTNSFASMTEFHLDAASSSATGGHVIITNRFNADAIDKRLGEAIKKYVGLRGGMAISKRNDLLQVNVAADRNINYRLVELGFITNKKDMDNIKKNIEAYCKALAEAITGVSSTVKASTPKKKVVSKAKQTVKTTAKPKAKSTNFDKRKGRKARAKAYAKGIVKSTNGKGAAYRKWSGDKDGNPTFKNRFGNDVPDGSVVYIFSTHKSGWARIYSHTNKGWIHLDQVQITEVY